MSELSELNELQQKFFDQSVAGLASQDFQQCKIGSICQYSEGDRRCAIGWLVPVPRALPEGDITAVYSAFLQQVSVPVKYQDPIYNFLTRLQVAHDSAENANKISMRQRLRTLANDYGLTLPAVLKADPYER